MNHRLLTLLLVALLALVAVVATGEAAAAAPQPQQPEWEPNNSFDDANWIGSGVRQHGRIDPAGDVDYYLFNHWGEDTFYVDTRLPESSPLKPVIALYDEEQNLLMEAECPRDGRCLTYMPGASSHFYVVVSDRDGRSGPAYEYSFIILVEDEPQIDPYEPNDFLSEATPYTLGQEIRALMEPAGDIDNFVFTLDRAVDLVAITNNAHNLRLLDANGRELYATPWPGSQTILSIPAPGTYYVQVHTEVIGEDPPYRLQLLAAPRSIYVSFAGKGRVGGVAFGPADVLRYYTLDGSWHPFFRAADYGVGGNVVGFGIGKDTSDLYFTFAAAQNIPGVGRVTPSDVVRYTAGYPEWGIDPGWERVFIGAHLGLTTAAERIDALVVDANWGNDRTYYVSTSGRARLPYAIGQLLVNNNDVISFSGWIDENGTSQFFMQTVLGGQAAGLGAANVTGLDWEETAWYFTFERPIQLGGMRFAPGDIVICTRDWSEEPCAHVGKLFDASDAGVGSYRIDAIDVGPRELP